MTAATTAPAGGELVETRDGYGDRAWWLVRQSEDGTSRYRATGPQDSRVPFIGYPVRDVHTCVACYLNHSHTLDWHRDPAHADHECLCGCQAVER